MTVVTSSSNKTEILAELQRVNDAHAALRTQVVKVALSKAKAHGWCEVVKKALKEMGLGDLLPAVYLVQRKESATARFKNWDDEHTNVSAARRAARYYRQHDVNDAQYRYERATETGRFAPRSSNAQTTLRIDITPHLTVESVSAQIEAAIAAARRAANEQKAAPKFEKPEYPIYRVVSKAGNGKITVLD